MRFDFSKPKLRQISEIKTRCFPIVNRVSSRHLEKGKKLSKKGIGDLIRIIIFVAANTFFFYHREFDCHWLARIATSFLIFLPYMKFGSRK